MGEKLIKEYVNMISCQYKYEFQMTFTQTLLLTATLGIIAIYGTGWLLKSYRSSTNAVYGLSGLVMIGLVLWYILQIVFSIELQFQNIDFTAIFIGLLVAYGFQSAITLIQDRVKIKQK